MCVWCYGKGSNLHLLGGADGGCHGNTFVSSSQDQHIMIWSWDPDSEETTLVSVCKGHSESVESVAPSPDGQKVRLFVSFFFLLRLYFAY